MNHSSSSIGTAPPAADIEAFVTRWRGSTASELSTAQSFTIELCELLGVPRPHATAEQDYMFERPLTLMHGDGTSSARMSRRPSDSVSCSVLQIIVFKCFQLLRSARRKCPVLVAHVRNRQSDPPESPDEHPPSVSAKI